MKGPELRPFHLYDGVRSSDLPRRMFHLYEGSGAQTGLQSSDLPRRRSGAQTVPPI